MFYRSGEPELRLPPIFGGKLLKMQKSRADFRGESFRVRPACDTETVLDRRISHPPQQCPPEAMPSLPAQVELRRSVQAVASGPGVLCGSQPSRGRAGRGCRCSYGRPALRPLPTRLGRSSAEESQARTCLEVRGHPGAATHWCRKASEPGANTPPGRPALPGGTLGLPTHATHLRRDIFSQSGTLASPEIGPSSVSAGGRPHRIVPTGRKHPVFGRKIPVGL